jgi:hypothetical protein
MFDKDSPVILGFEADVVRRILQRQRFTDGRDSTWLRVRARRRSVDRQWAAEMFTKCPERCFFICGITFWRHVEEAGNVGTYHQIVIFIGVVGERLA